MKEFIIGFSHKILLMIGGLLLLPYPFFLIRGDQVTESSFANYFLQLGHFLPIIAISVVLITHYIYIKSMDRLERESN